MAYALSSKNKKRLIKGCLIGFLWFLLLNLGDLFYSSNETTPPPPKISEGGTGATVAENPSQEDANTQKEPAVQIAEFLEKKVKPRKFFKIHKVIPQIAEREPDAVESANILPITSVLSPVNNEKYNESKVSVQGLLWTVQSSQQVYQNRPAPVIAGLELKGMHWIGSQGFEGIFKVGVMGVNKEGSENSLKDLEARYHYRFFTGSPFFHSRETQISFFAGYEVYRNVNEFFSKNYDLFKFGSTIEFPWSDNWSAGGEFVYGIGLDNSNKQEISGHVSYFFTKQLAFGVGYRLHFFTAGSAASSAGGYLPYREGYTEGFSSIDYHF